MSSSSEGTRLRRRRRLPFGVKSSEISTLFKFICLQFLKQLSVVGKMLFVQVSRLLLWNQIDYSIFINWEWLRVFYLKRSSISFFCFASSSFFSLARRLASSAFLASAVPPLFTCWLTCWMNFWFLFPFLFFRPKVLSCITK